MTSLSLLKKVKKLFLPCQENDYTPGLFESDFFAYYIVLLLLLGILTTSVILILPKTGYFADIQKSVILEMTNRERTRLGLEPLKENRLLDEAALLKAGDMLAFDYFSHFSPQGKSPWFWFKKVGYNFSIAGENLGIGFLDSEEIFRAWWNSPNHRANLLNPSYKEIGIAILQGDFQGNQTTVVVEVFARPSIHKNRLSRVVFSAPIKKTSLFSKNLQEQTSISKDLYSNKLSSVDVSTQDKEFSVEEDFQTSKNKNIFLVQNPINSAVKGAVFYENPVAFQRESFFVRVLRFVVSRLPQIIEISLFVAVSLVFVMTLAILFSKNSFKSPDLIIRSIFYVAILFVFFIFEKQNFLSLIPHPLGY